MTADQVCRAERRQRDKTYAETSGKHPNLVKDGNYLDADSRKRFTGGPIGDFLPDGVNYDFLKQG
jgi:hypothetical protein